MSASDNSLSGLRTFLLYFGFALLLYSFCVAALFYLTTENGAAFSLDDTIGGFFRFFLACALLLSVPVAICAGLFSILICHTQKEPSYVRWLIWGWVSSLPISLLIGWVLIGTEPSTLAKCAALSVIGVGAAALARFSASRSGSN